MFKQGDYVETVAEPRVIARFDGWHNSLARTNRGLWSKGRFRPWSPRVGERVVFWCKNDPTEIEGTISTLGASGMGNEAFGFGISGLRPASNHPIEFMRPVLDAPKGEEPKLYVPSKGERVRITYKSPDSTAPWNVGEKVTVERAHACVCGCGFLSLSAAGYSGGICRVEPLPSADPDFTRLAPLQPLGDGDRLCDACGSPSVGEIDLSRSEAERQPHLCGVFRYCAAHGKLPFDRCEPEIVARRKQLAEKPATASPLVDVTKYRAEKPRYPNTGFVPYADRVGLQSLSEPKPDDGPAYVNANWPEGSEYWGQG